MGLRPSVEVRAVGFRASCVPIDETPRRTAPLTSCHGASSCRMRQSHSPQSNRQSGDGGPLASGQLHSPSSVSPTHSCANALVALKDASDGPPHTRPPLLVLVADSPGQQPSFTQSHLGGERGGRRVRRRTGDAAWGTVAWRPSLPSAPLSPPAEFPPLAAAGHGAHCSGRVAFSVVVTAATTAAVMCRLHVSAVASTHADMRAEVLTCEARKVVPLRVKAMTHGHAPEGGLCGANLHLHWTPGHLSRRLRSLTPAKTPAVWMKTGLGQRR